MQDIPQRKSVGKSEPRLADRDADGEYMTALPDQPSTSKIVTSMTESLNSLFNCLKHALSRYGQGFGAIAHLSVREGKSHGKCLKVPFPIQVEERKTS